MVANTIAITDISACLTLHRDGQIINEVASPLGKGREVKPSPMMCLPGDLIKYDKLIMYVNTHYGK